MMMGWGRGIQERHLPSRELKDAGSLIPAKWLTVALMFGTGYNPLLNSRSDFTYCKMIQPSGPFITGPWLWILRFIGVIRVSFLAMDELPKPVSQSCSPKAGVSCHRTSTGKRSSLNCCLDFDNNFHFSLAGNCLFASFSLRPQPVVSSPLFGLPLVSVSMPRLRHRMRCRRGSSRGRLRRPSPSPSSTSSSSSHEGSSSLSRGRRTRSGRCMSSPLASHPPAQTHTTQFSFNCALSRPRVTATITVAFREDPQHVDPNSSGVRDVPLLSEIPPLQGPGNLAQQGHVSTISMQAGQASVQLSAGQASEVKTDNGLQSSKQNDNGRDLGGKAPSSPRKVIHSIADLFDADGNPDALWCRVIEEAPDE